MWPHTGGGLNLWWPIFRVTREKEMVARDSGCWGDDGDDGDRLSFCVYANITA